MPRDTPDHAPPGDVRIASEGCRARLSEVWMLTDFVAGQSKKGLRQIELNDEATQKPYEPKALLDRLHDIQSRADRNALETGDCSFVEVTRDALNGLVWPASSLTVAYTTLVAGPFRKRAASRVEQAARAFPNLEGRAALHRVLHTVILLFAVCITGVAAWQSAHVALGKALLQNLTELQVKQDQLNLEKSKLELKPNPADASNPPLGAYRVCDRALVLYASRIHKTIDDPEVIIPSARVLTYDTPEAANLCGQDDVLRAHLGTAHRDLQRYMQDWSSVMHGERALVKPVTEPGQSPQPIEDAELRVAPVLLVWGNLVLPIIFATIGSAIYVILDNYKKIVASVLDPRDLLLAPVRLVLGFIVGACIGLIFSAAGPTPPVAGPATASSLISSLTLTASGIAFLVGFGVETVFTLLDTLITRVFTLQTADKT